MKHLFLGLLVLIGAMGLQAANLLESYHLKSLRGLSSPDLLVKFFDDGTCSTEVNNFDGSKDYMLTECSVSDTEWIEKKIITSHSCSKPGNVDTDFPKSYSLNRGRSTIEIDGVLFIRPTSKTLRDYAALKTCE